MICVLTRGSEEASDLNVMLGQMRGWQVESQREEGGPPSCVGGTKRALSLPPSRKGQTHNTSRSWRVFLLQIDISNQSR